MCRPQSAPCTTRQVSERTLPWMDDGTRILKGAVFMAYSPRRWPSQSGSLTKRSRRSSLPIRRSSTKHAAVSAMPAWNSDFPAESRLKQRFGVKLTYLPVPSTEDFPRGLSEDEIAAVHDATPKKPCVARSTMHCFRCSTACRNRLRAWQPACGAFRRTSGGKVQHPFRDSLVENVRAIVQARAGTEPHG